MAGYRNKIDALNVLIKEGADVHFYTYEKFLAEGLDYLGRVTKVVGLEKPNCVDTFEKDKKRTHSGKRCDTQGGLASNCEELQALFHAQHFPTWKELAADHYNLLIE